MNSPSRAEPWLVAAGLAAVAAAAPVPLYLLALALFGLPHVMWELAWIRRRFAGCYPPAWWALAGTLLAVQATARAGAALGLLPEALVPVSDIAVLAALLTSLPLALRGHPPVERALATAAAAATGLALFAASREGATLVLMALAVAHNFTPVLLNRHRPDAALYPRLFLLPPLLALGLAALGGHWSQTPHLAAFAPPEASLFGAPGAGGIAAALLPALVLAQCLHYYSVLRLMPAGAAPLWPSPRWRWLAIGLSAALFAGFCADYAGARRIYAIAAGAHAWLEWPLVLLLVVQAGPSRTVSTALPG